MNIPTEWIKASPFKNKKKLLETLKKHEKGEEIGFTFKSSLKSMGIIPRSNGDYVISEKYKNL